MARFTEIAAALCLEAIVLIVAMAVFVLWGSMLAIASLSVMLVLTEYAESAIPISIPYTLWRLQWLEMIDTLI